MFWVHQWIPVKDQGTHSVPPQKERSHSSCRKDKGDKSESSSDSISSDEEGSVKEFKEEEEEEDGEGSSSYADEISPDISDPN